MFCLWSHSTMSQFAASVPLHRPRVLYMPNVSTLVLRVFPLVAWSDLFVAVTQASVGCGMYRRSEAKQPFFFPPLTLVFVCACF